MENIKQKVAESFYNIYSSKLYELKNVMLIPDMFYDTDNDTFICEYIDLKSKKKETKEWSIKRKDIN